MHTNQQTIKKNDLNQIREIFMTSRVDNSRSIYFFLFSMIFQVVPLQYRVRAGVQMNKGFLFLTLLIFSTHEIKRVRWRQKRSEIISLFFFF